MTYSLHPGAEHDVADAMDFYSEHAGPVVAARFLQEFERVAKLLVEHPGLGTPTTTGRRTFLHRHRPLGVLANFVPHGGAMTTRPVLCYQTGQIMNP